MLSPECLQMMQNGMASPDLVEDDRKTNLIVNYLPQTMTQVPHHAPWRLHCWSYSILVLHFRRRSAPSFLPLARLRAASSSGTRLLVRASATALSTTTGRRTPPRLSRHSMGWDYKTKQLRWTLNSLQSTNPSKWNLFMTSTFAGLLRPPQQWSHQGG